MKNVEGISELTTEEMMNHDGGIVLIAIAVGYLLFKPGALDNLIEGVKDGYESTRLQH